MAAYHCCVPFCNSDSRYNVDKKISFHRIPAFHVEPKRHRDWLNRIRREPGPSFKVSSCTRVCSKHFLPSDFVRTLTGKRNLKPTSVPCIFQWTTNDLMEQPPPSPKRNLGNNLAKNTLQPILPSQVLPPKVKSSLPNVWTTSVHDHCYDLPPMTEAEMLDAAREEIARLQQRSVALEKNLFFLERFSSDSSLVHFYTGFKDYATLKDVFSTLTPVDDNMVKWQHCQQEGDLSVCKGLDAEVESLALIDQFFMFLCKVRQGFFDQDLAVRFNVSEARVTGIIITWANYLYLVLGEVPLWRSRETGSQEVPECFKACYPRARVILHCAEVKVQTTNTQSITSSLYAYYNSQTTYKGLLGIAPHGAVIFISPLYSGSASIRAITKSSGILDLLEQDDLVITDRDFLIQDLVEAAGADLVILPIIATSIEDCNEAELVLHQAEEKQNGVIILASSAAEEHETLVLASTGLEDAVVELEQSAGEEEDCGEILMREVEVQEVMEEPIHSSNKETGLQSSPKTHVKIEQYSPEEVVVSTQDDKYMEDTREEESSAINALARLRICVDQDIERVKQYHLFEKVLPLSLGTVANQLWAVCAMLSNINGSLS
uniref:THAP-type domain-containing protein n=1 Tax=Leptobrachium leishanense TaxID=445787 RepID=A0A8C5Q909_9ANUR